MNGREAVACIAAEPSNVKSVAPRWGGFQRLSQCDVTKTVVWNTSCGNRKPQTSIQLRGGSDNAYLMVN